MTGEELRIKVRSFGVSQKELADRLNISPSAVNQYFTREIIRESTLRNVAAGLGVTLEELTSPDYKPQVVVHETKRQDEPPDVPATANEPVDSSFSEMLACITNLTGVCNKLRQDLEKKDKEIARLKELLARAGT